MVYRDLTTSTFYNCGKQGHYARNCKDKKDSNNSKSPGGHGKQKNNKSSWGKARAEDAAGQKWCPVHATTAHSDEDCC